MIRGSRNGLRGRWLRENYHVSCILLEAPGPPSGICEVSEVMRVSLTRQATQVRPCKSRSTGSYWRIRGRGGGEAWRHHRGRCAYLLDRTRCAEMPSQDALRSAQLATSRANGSRHRAPNPPPATVLATSPDSTWALNAPTPFAGKASAILQVPWFCPHWRMAVLEGPRHSRPVPRCCAGASATIRERRCRVLSATAPWLGTARPRGGPSGRSRGCGSVAR